jgi:hypothetical protein
MEETDQQIYNREYAETVFGNCDDGSVRPEDALWNDEVFRVEDLRHLMPKAESWLKEEMEDWRKDFGYESHWEKFLKAENFQDYLSRNCDGPPVISIDESGIIQIWDGWHRIACALIRNEETLTIRVGRKMEVSLAPVI